MYDRDKAISHDLYTTELTASKKKISVETCLHQFCGTNLQVVICRILLGSIMERSANRTVTDTTVP